jgi:hypothetical protein
MWVLDSYFFKKVLDSENVKIRFYVVNYETL